MDPSRIPDTFKLNPEMEQQFKQQYLIGTDYNNGITLKLTSFYDDPSDTQAKVFFDDLILNHTDEPILFSNIFLGIRIYSPNEISKEWIEIQTDIKPGGDTAIIPAHTETINLDTINSSYMLYSYIKKSNLPEKLRICVFGTGQATQQKYAACVDVLRKRK